MKTILLLLALTFLFISCEEDIDIFTEKKCGPIAYGLLNIKDSIHYIKLYETKENSENGKLYVADPNSYEVKIIEFVDGISNDTSVLNGKLVQTNTKSTIENETLYTYFKKLTINAEYKLQIENLKTNLITSNKIIPVGKRDNYYAVYNQYRAENFKLFGKWEQLDYEISPSSYCDFNINRIYYIDILPEGDKLRYFEYKNIDRQYFKDADTNFGNMHKVYFNMLAGEIPYKEGIERRMVGIDMYYEIPDEKLIEYCDQHFLSTIKDIEISNEIDNGFGIFASKYYWCYLALCFDQTALDSLAYSEVTGHLGFLNIPWEPQIID